MPAYSSGAQAALLKAVCLFQPLEVQPPQSTDPDAQPQVNGIFKLESAADSFDKLTNGVVLGDILHQLDPEFNPSDLEPSHGTATKYLTNKRNIQAIYKGLFRFVRRKVPELACQAKKFDYNAIADNPDAQGISQVG
jgi:protein HOOK3